MNKLLGYILSLLREEQSFDIDDVIEKLRKYLRRNKDIYSVIVYKENHLLMEEYFNDFNPEIMIPINSITKSVISILIGILIDQHGIESVDHKLVDLLPEIKAYNKDLRINDIKIRHLLTMTSGIDYQSSLENLRFFESLENQMEYYLKKPLLSNPGEVFNYSEINAYLLAILIERITSLPVSEFAQKYLFKKIDIQKFEWAQDKNQHNYGGTGLKLKCRDLIKVGLLYYNQGIYHNEKVISEKWIKESTKIHSTGGKPVDDNYGFLWWIKKVVSYDSYFAYGYGGQLLFIIPEIKMVILLCSKYEHN